MIYTRRAFMGLSLGSAISLSAERLLGQGVAAHAAKPLARQAPSGRPFNAHFVDVGAAAGLHAPTIYGGVESKKYILESTGSRTHVYKMRIERSARRGLPPKRLGRVGRDSLPQ